MPSKSKSPPLGNAPGLPHNSNHTRRNGSNTRSNSARSRVNGILSNSPGKETISLPTRDELYTLYRGYSRKNKPKLKGTLKGIRIPERNLRGASLNAVNIQGQVNTRRSLPSREELLNQFKQYSAKNKSNKGSKFVPNDLMIEMDEVIFNYEPVEGDPEFSDEEIRDTVKRLKKGQGRSWFLQPEVEHTLRKKFSNDKEVDNVLKNLKEVEDKYLNQFPEEELKIKKYIRIKYNHYHTAIENNTIDMFRPIKEHILQATKELRDAIYERAPVSKKNEIIDKYTKHIRYMFSTYAPNIHLPLVRLLLEVFYYSLEFGVPSHRTTKHVSERKQLMVAIETKEVKGNKVPTKDKYHYVDLMLEMDNVLFEYNEQGRRRVKVINDETDEFAYLFKLKEIRDKYLSAFPEEKDIKRDISIIYEILCKQVETRDTPFGNEIIEAKKELRDAFYGRYDNQTFFTKKDEIIDKYEKDIQSRITSVYENPHILLILELYYTSLAFSYRSLRTTNNVQLRAERRLLLETAQKNQLRIASKSKGVDGKMELTNANKQRVDSRKSAF